MGNSCRKADNEEDIGKSAMGRTPVSATVDKVDDANLEGLDGGSSLK